MTTPYQCEFCKKYFSSKSSLNIHKNKARYCISQRGKDISHSSSSQKSVEYNNLLARFLVMEKIIEDQRIELENLKDRSDRMRDFLFSKVKDREKLKRTLDELKI